MEEKTRKSRKGAPKWHVQTKDGYEPLKPYKFIRHPERPLVRLIPLTLKPILESKKWKDFYEKFYLTKEFEFIDDKRYRELANEAAGKTVRIKPKRKEANITQKNSPEKVVIIKRKKKVKIKEPEPEPEPEPQPEPEPESEHESEPEPIMMKKVEKLSPQQLHDFDESYLDYLYPNVNNKDFIKKISSHREFDSTKYDGTIYKIKERSDELCEEDFELMPHQNFVRNLLSFNTPYNSLLLYHGLGTGKTCSAIGICEEMRGYMKQVGSSRPIIVVAAPNVQDNFRLQLFDPRKLVMKGDEWNLNTCVGASLLKEVNPTQIKNVDKKKIIDQINNIIKTNYVFLGYGKFANYINRKTSIPLNANYSEEDKKRIKRNRIRRFFNNCLIVIDEVHNLRITNDNTGSNKKTAELLMEIAEESQNMRLLLLSATPMYNSYEEIIWLTNLMCINDKKNPIKINNIFNTKGGFQKKGKELLIRKLNGYISYVRGENPYLFPMRIYAKTKDYFKHKIKTPTMQLNSKKIESNLKFLPLFDNQIGSYQKKVYDFIISTRKKKKEEDLFFKMDKNKKLFENMDSFGYELLQKPLECLNVCFPNVDIKFDKDYDSSERDHLISTMIGKHGLKNIMNFKTTPKDSIKYNFEYKYPELGRLFHLDHLHKYSAKMHNICKIVKQTKGIILIYSQFLDGGAIPMALALEEMGFTRYCSDSSIKPLLKEPPEPIDSITMKSNEDIAYEINNAKEEYENAVKELEDFVEQCKNGEEDKEECETIIEELTQVRDEAYEKYLNEKNSFNQAKYIIVSGDKSYSPNNDADIKYLNQPDNKYGKNVKVVIISLAGSEGIDYKNIRQIHILEPWYNMNRLEQIKGRGIRSMSHCLLPFEQRNCEIFLHSTNFNNNIEAADRYVYRVAEKKSENIGKLTRLIKENAVDCLLNVSQTNFSQDKLASLKENKNIEIEMPNGNTRTVQMGDMPYSNICDYMESCSLTCNSEEVSEINESTNHKNFIVTTNEKIISMIKDLFTDIPGERQGKYYFKLDELVNSININKKYSLYQIYFALDELLNNENEIIYDTNNRKGRLINKGDYYLFQPLEITDESASIYQRQNPVHYKHSHIDVELPIMIRQEEKQENNFTELLDSIKTKANIVFNKTESDEEFVWYNTCVIILPHLKKHYKIDDETIHKMTMMHIIDSLTNEDKKVMYNNIYNSDWKPDDEIEVLMKFCFDEKIININDEGSSLIMNEDKTRKYYILNNGKWIEAEYTDIQEILKSKSFKEKMVFKKSSINNIYGFFSHKKGENEMSFKIRDMSDKVNNKGAMVKQMLNKDILSKMNAIIGKDEYNNENISKYLGIQKSRDSRTKLVVLMEIIIRFYDIINKNNKKWLLTEEQISINDVNNKDK